MKTLDLLRDLIAFPTVSADPNRALIDYCAELLRGVGAKVEVIADPVADKANLFATIGPLDRPGVLLSGHTDVVPVIGQDWSHEPFKATVEDGKVFGRGTADMKGFVASALRAALNAGELVTPLHLALSYDEEIGCVGVRFRPRFCIVGEPTAMGVATGHKGKTAFRVTCIGQEAHSALAPTGLNAIYLASDMIQAIRKVQEKVALGAQDEDYDVAYSTLHVGTINGGTALNIVPNHATFLAEIRNLSDDDPLKILDDLRLAAAKILARIQPDFPNANIEIEITNTYPPLGTAPDAEVVHFVKSLTGANGTMKVAFGTEGGLFDADLGIPTVICGPGSMAQGHKPDEFVCLEQLDKCDAMMDALLAQLHTGL